jgi:hypothetical protein
MFVKVRVVIRLHDHITMRDSECTFFMIKFIFSISCGICVVNYKNSDVVASKFGILEAYSYVLLNSSVIYAVYS